MKSQIPLNKEISYKTLRIEFTIISKCPYTKEQTLYNIGLILKNNQKNHFKNNKPQTILIISYLIINFQKQT